LSETDAAIAALEEVLAVGWLPGCWGLKQGAFDPDYAVVIEDPRFTASLKTVCSDCGKTFIPIRNCQQT